ncbi:uncharacterized protein BDZ83DRAFT_727266 [Colletotrichum acutatum]|uniref:Uncharacterized protein n=1 Tax=Glomerella acutata TaxID=27357 RepID=A0AAD9CZX4_GLOAC|nr:uncharacterized protein BDZ83DRAFT_727266 [Colletotrichum acutatum]KAK1729578.1 hypothetical protein BDZ83DRAFT_727266 [Colletotrichum acutatum]
MALEASQAALAASNSQMSASEIANLTEKFKIGTAEEIPIIEEQGGIALTSEEIVAQDILSVVRAGMLEEEVIGAEAIAAVRGLARAGIYGLIAAVVVFGMSIPIPSALVQYADVILDRPWNSFPVSGRTHRLRSSRQSLKRLRLLGSTFKSKKRLQWRIRL